MTASVSETWGTTAAERELPFPCDALISQPDAVLYRGVDVDAPPAHVFRWLCQLRVAPYSYDNFGRQSPPELIPGLDRLEVGQDMVAIFSLADFERDRHVTLRSRSSTPGERIFGDVVITYLVVPATAGCRLLVKVLVRYPPGLLGLLESWLLPWGDLIMMRRQLLNLKALCESTAAERDAQGIGAATSVAPSDPRH